MKQGKLKFVEGLVQPASEYTKFRSTPLNKSRKSSEHVCCYPAWPMSDSQRLGTRLNV